MLIPLAANPAGRAWRYSKGKICAAGWARVCHPGGAILENETIWSIIDYLYTFQFDEGQR